MQTVAHKAQAKDVYKLDMSLILPYEPNQLLCTLVCYKTCVKPLYCVCESDQSDHENHLLCKLVCLQTCVKPLYFVYEKLPKLTVEPIPLSPPMFNLGWLEFHSNVTVITLYPSHYFSQFTPFDCELDIL